MEPLGGVATETHERADFKSEVWRRAKEIGRSEDLIGRALTAGMSRLELERLLRPRALSDAMAEQIIVGAERLASGAVSVRDLTMRDLDQFSALWSSSAEIIGDWIITVERAPNPVAQFRLQEAPNVTVVEDIAGGKGLVACIAWSTMNVPVGGKSVSVVVAHGLRVHGERRREGFGELARVAPYRALMKPFQAQLMYLRVDNVGMSNFLGNAQYQNKDGRLQGYAVVAHFPTTDLPANPRVRHATEADLAACALLINRTQDGLDLFRSITADDLDLRLREGAWGNRPADRPAIYGWPDYYVLETEAGIQACAGLWNRGRDIREVWTSRTSGQRRVVDYAAVLDLGWADGAEPAAAELLRQLMGEAGRMGRSALAVHLQHAPAVLEALGDLAPTPETRIIDWTSFGPSAPTSLGSAHVDLRYW